MPSEKGNDNKDDINAPAHYRAGDTYECVKVAEAWGLHKNAYLFNVLKYVSRHELKGTALKDLKKAAWYLDREIANMEKEEEKPETFSSLFNEGVRLAKEELKAKGLPLNRHETEEPEYTLFGVKIKAD